MRSFDTLPFASSADQFTWAEAKNDKGGGGGKPSGTPGGDTGGGGGDTVSYTYTSGLADDLTTDYFNIEVNYMGEGWTLDSLSAIAAAADYLSRLITAGLPEDEGIDDVSINVSLSSIDTLGGTIAQGRPLSVRSSDNATPDGLTVTGEIIFDSNDVDLILANESLDDLALHEMMHVLGVGTLWSVPGVRDFLSDPVFVPDLSTKNPKDGTTIIEYTGGAVDDTGALPQVETEGSLGHWSEDAYGDELMTTVFNINGNYMSQMTADALADLGYAVDDAVAAELASAIDLGGIYTLDDFAIA
ncbi:hypothetical protein [Roseovarius aestuariivivens]|uniref:hypothetical protein n=1 Tax=Roseovarius aestuariivivens TaxID=1888910 RepID=UPI00108001B4|nr:hypothetical protein [Roseovarius aestuariivivens]